MLPTGVRSASSTNSHNSHVPCFNDTHHAQPKISLSKTTMNQSIVHPLKNKNQMPSKTKISSKTLYKETT